jgi:hypothetical protein
MNVPVVRQPDIATITSELTAWHRWMIAYRRDEKPLPVLPTHEDEPSTVTLLSGIIVRCPLLALGWLARKGGLPFVRQWAAATRVRLDWMAGCPASCSMNRAFTELGLAMVEAGNVEAAVECLDASWRVHPCPHNTSLGLSPRLWTAIAAIPNAEKGRGQYEEVARRFAAGFGVP